MDATALFRQIEQTAEYKEHAVMYSGREILIRKEFFFQMCQDVRHFEGPLCVYDLVHDRVGYVHMDCVDYGWNVGYRNAFAYLLHSITPVQANRRGELALKIACRYFFFMNINPARIFGVSGTLSALCDYEWRVMRQYGLKQYILLPWSTVKATFGSWTRRAATPSRSSNPRTISRWPLPQRVRSTRARVVRSLSSSRIVQSWRSILRQVTRAPCHIGAC